MKLQRHFETQNDIVPEQPIKTPESNSNVVAQEPIAEPVVKPPVSITTKAPNSVQPTPIVTQPQKQTSTPPQSPVDEKELKDQLLKKPVYTNLINRYKEYINSSEKVNNARTQEAKESYMKNIKDFKTSLNMLAKEVNKNPEIIEKLIKDVVIPQPKTP